MNPTLSFLQKYWFLLALCLVAPLGVAFPEGGRWLSDTKPALPILVATTLCASGFLLDTGRLALQATNFRAIALTLLSTYGAAPFFAFLLAGICEPTSPTTQEGFFLQAMMVTAAQAGTLASAIAFTILARGDQELALVLTVVSNALTVLLTPLVLDASLGTTISFPVMEMMGRMALIVLLPVAVGQILRRILSSRVTHWSPVVGRIPQCLMLVFVYTGFANAGEHLRQDFLLVGRFLGASIALHLILLAWTSGCSRLFRFSRDVRAAVVLCGSQKTLPNGIYVWQAYFPHNPYCPVALVVFHLGQLVIDTLLLPWITGKPEKKS